MREGKASDAPCDAAGEAAKDMESRLVKGAGTVQGRDRKKAEGAQAEDDSAVDPNAEVMKREACHQVVQRTVARRQSTSAFVSHTISIWAFLMWDTFLSQFARETKDTTLQGISVSLRRTHFVAECCRLSVLRGKVLSAAEAVSAARPETS